MRTINKYISYIEGYDEPLSADVGVICTDQHIWLFDVGHGATSLAEIQKIQEHSEAAGRPAACVLSHFHADHTGNIKDIGEDLQIYAGDYTCKYIKRGTIVTGDLYLSETPQLHIFRLPSCHAKGCVGLEVNEEYAFLGDGLYPMQKGTCRVYNVQLLKAQMEVLSKLKARKLLLSHRMDRAVDKEAALRLLQKIYEGRSKDSPYIEMSDWFLS